MITIRDLFSQPLRAIYWCKALFIKNQILLQSLSTVESTFIHLKPSLYSLTLSLLNFYFQGFRTIFQIKSQFNFQYGPADSHHKLNSRADRWLKLKVGKHTLEIRSPGSYGIQGVPQKYPSVFKSGFLCQDYQFNLDLVLRNYSPKTITQ